MKMLTATCVNYIYANGELEARHTAGLYYKGAIAAYYDTLL